ncbi:MAG TPA: hypothetical protein VMM60_06470 [Ilumatobacter sp.]|nr:hypothetical protein [Ilumatobacter sp.]
MLKVVNVNVDGRSLASPSSGDRDEADKDGTYAFVNHAFKFPGSGAIGLFRAGRTLSTAIPVE